MSASIIGRDGAAIASDANGIPISTPDILQRVGGPTPQPNFVGCHAIVSINDHGEITGNKYLKGPMTTDDKRLMVGLDTPLLNYTFNSTASNTGLWQFQQAAVTMAASEGGGFLTLNSGSVLTAAAGCAYQTDAYYTLMGNAGIHVEFTINPSLTIIANQIIEVGLFKSWASGGAAAAPADGAFFRITNAGVIGITTFNGTETPTSTFAAPVAGTSTEYSFVITEREVQFWKEDILLSEITVPSGQGQPFLSGALPFCMQTRNSGLVVGSIALPRFSDVHIDQRDLNLGKSFPDVVAKLGQMGSQGQQGGTMGSTANTSAAGNTTTLGVAAALSNSVLGTGNLIGFGGFVHYLPTLTAGPVAAVKGILSAGLNPIGSVNQIPRTLYIKGVFVSQAVGVVLTGGPVIGALSLFYGSTLLTLATAADTASFTTNTVKAPRMQPLGIQSCIAAAAAGVSLTGPTYFPLTSAIAVNPGEYFGVCQANLGTVTTVGEIEAVVGYDFYFE